jgi:hypothetical protein
LNWRVSIEVPFENVMVVVVDKPNVAVPVGTVAGPVAGTQLAAVFQSLGPWGSAPGCVLRMSRDCAEPYADKQHQSNIAQHPDM